MSRSLYEKIERGVARPQKEFAADCDSLFEVPDIFAELQRAATRQPHPSWFAPRVELEEQADIVTDWVPETIPGLLQTPEFALSIVRANRPYADPAAVQGTVDRRLARQEILLRDNPPKFWLVLSECALRQTVGSAAVMRGQLDRLVELGESSLVVIQVLPFACPDGPGADGPLALFERNGHRPVAYAEGYGGGRVIEAPGEVAEVTEVLNVIKSCALSPLNSLALIREIREGW